MNNQQSLMHTPCPVSLWFIPLFVVIFLSSCDQRTEYEIIVDRELSKSERMDSLFLGYYFGMTSSEFFDHSWQLNSDGIVTGQTTIHYQLDNLKQSATKYFYPAFEDDKIFRLPIEMSYDAWAPWNRDLFSDSLIVDLMDLYNDMYQAEFIYTDIPDLEEKTWVSVQSNRRIVLTKLDDTTVQIEFLDLSVHNPR